MLARLLKWGRFEQVSWSIEISNRLCNLTATPAFKFGKIHRKRTDHKVHVARATDLQRTMLFLGCPCWPFVFGMLSCEVIVFSTAASSYRNLHILYLVSTFLTFFTRPFSWCSLYIKSQSVHIRITSHRNFKSWRKSGLKYLKFVLHFVRDRPLIARSYAQKDLITRHIWNRFNR